MTLIEAIFSLAGAVAVGLAICALTVRVTR
jgi:hypothetical protein